ncbi:MAG: hypothetical protein NC095_06055 [Muribaculum sp.]|nr:hypothetical protein [Muribaculum sp.]
MSIILAVLAIAMIGGGCHRRNEAKERIQAEREAWEASLPDSLKAIERQADSIRNEIKTLSLEMERMLPSFDYVNNPREVEGYYIAKSWKANYPLKATGLTARLTQGENLELIAALSGGAHFDRIRVEAGGESVESSRVPYDQALNYRMPGLNTVCFSDSAANSCARLIASHNGSDIKITYLNDSKKTGSLNYPKQSQSAMTETWNLYDTRVRMQHDERLIPLLARKAAIITERIERTEN